MKWLSARACVLLVILFCITWHLTTALPFGGEDDGSSGRRSVSVKVRNCRGKQIKPTRTRAAVDAKCKKEFPASQRCARLCRLEQLKVVTSRGINEKSWRSYAEYSFPTSLIGEIVPKMKACGEHYEPGTSSSSSPDCKENEKFISCLGDALEEVCQDQVEAVEVE